MRLRQRNVTAGETKKKVMLHTPGMQKTNCEEVLGGSRVGDRKKNGADHSVQKKETRSAEGEEEGSESSG